MADLNYEEILDKNILDILGAKNMSEEQKRNIFTKALETIQNRVIMRISDKLSEPEVDEWKKILDSGDKKQAEMFLKNKGLDLPKLLAEEALIYKTELAELMR
ncbi:MAG: DUF5663 domain-containing protein [Patescibacteria group bacterium]|nr:DUF5663 domain-containing protein [Patescibacteria group bacterium]